MKSQKNFKKLAKEWFLKAKEDELSAKDILKDKEGAASTVCFLSQQKEAKFLTDFYIITRYPGDYPQLSFKDAGNAFKNALKIKNFVLRKSK